MRAAERNSLVAATNFVSCHRGGGSNVTVTRGGNVEGHEDLGKECVIIIIILSHHWFCSTKSPSQTLVVDFQRENPGFNIICTTKGFWVLNINTVCTTC